jgi:hypothetical protein
MACESGAWGWKLEGAQLWVWTKWAQPLPMNHIGSWDTLWYTTFQIRSRCSMASKNRSAPQGCHQCCKMSRWNAFFNPCSASRLPPWHIDTFWSLFVHVLHLPWPNPIAVLLQESSFYLALKSPLCRGTATWTWNLHVVTGWLDIQI